MLLAIDIGNSKTVFGILRGGRILSLFKFPTSYIHNRDFAFEIRKNFNRSKMGLSDIDGIIISSVVPQATPHLRRTLRQIFQIRPLSVSPSLRLGIRLGYKNPLELGQDRIANAVAAYKIYSGPIIIVDYGTAVTICLITKSGYYRGGIILPGTEMIASALAEKTSLLPYIETLNKPETLIGRTTRESIISGLSYGLSEMVDGLIRKVRGEIKTHVKVISTGGSARFLFPYSREIDKIEPDLTLKGLYFIYEMNKNAMD